MSDEAKVDKTDEANVESKVDEGVVIENYLKSQTYIDKMNAEKGKWAESYRAEKLPEIESSLREQIMKELNPEETESEKRLRLVEEELRTSREQIAKNKLQENLRVKAKEIGFDTTRADRYADFGEKAEEIMVADHEYMKSYIDTALDKLTKENFDTEDPSKSIKNDDKYSFEETMKDTLSKIRK